MKIHERIASLLEAKKISKTRVVKELGIKGSFYDWENGRGTISVDALIKFSDYFQVSLDYLVRGTEWNTGQNNTVGTIMDHNTKQMTELFEQLPLNSKLKVIGYTEALLETTKELDVEKRLSV